jgi:hypothetical protein
MLSNILLPSLSPYMVEIICDYQCVFWCNRSESLHLSDTVEEMGIQWDSASAIHRLQESIWFGEEESIYSILIEFVVPMKFVRLIKMCFNET